MTTSLLKGLPSRAERRAQRKAMRAQQKAHKARLDATLKKQLEKMRKTPLFIAAEKRRMQKRRRNLLIALLIALLLLLLSRCECDDMPEYGPPSNEPATVVYVPEPEPIAKKPGRGRTKKKDRPQINVEPPPPPPWLAQFRLQVAARSPRLATCLNGIERAGALQLSGLVHAKSGRVTAAKVEPVFRGSKLTNKQLDCLVQKLIEQPYKLEDPDPEAAARRVSLIFEF